MTPDSIGGQVWITTAEGLRKPNFPIAIVQGQSFEEVNSFGRFRTPLSIVSKFSFSDIVIEMNGEKDHDFYVTVPFSAVLSGSIIVYLDTYTGESEVVVDPGFSFWIKFALLFIFVVVLLPFVWKRLGLQKIAIAPYQHDTAEPLDPALKPEQIMGESIGFFRNHARKIDDNSVVYLFVGIMVALVGVSMIFLTFFLSKPKISTDAGSPSAGRDPVPASQEMETPRDSPSGEGDQPRQERRSEFESDMIEVVYYSAPRFGMVLLIELIAFFFLKQYRVAMDEFRYYQEIRRQLEASLVIYLSSQGRDVDFFKLVEACSFFRNPRILKEGETTELIEASKLHQKDHLLEELAKLVEAVKK